MAYSLRLDGTAIVADGWNWERDAAGFYTTHHTFFLIAALSYYPVIFGIKFFFAKNREALNLDRHSAINWIFWWEAALALFSIVGALHVVPMALEPILAGQSFAATICQPGVHDDPRSFWTFLFMLSKVAEFGDTIFVVLRKKPLILLQHYHHMATMLYCWCAYLRPSCCLPP